MIAREEIEIFVYKIGTRFAFKVIYSRINNCTPLQGMLFRANFEIRDNQIIVNYRIARPSFQ